MRLALNEVWNTALKAARAAGVGNGIAEDVADAAAWLCRHGEDGLAATAAALGDPLPVGTAAQSGVAGSGTQVQVGPEQDDREPDIVNTWTFADARVALAGPSALDLLNAGLCDRVRFESLDAPWLLLGLAGAEASRRGCAFCIGWHDGTACTVTPVGVVLGAPPVAKPSPDSQTAPAHPSATLSRSEWRTPHDGLDLDIEDHSVADANTLARGVLVPSSEASRARGAGDGNASEPD